MAGEVTPFSGLADVSITLSSELSTAFNLLVNVQLLTNSKSLLDVISKSSRTSKQNDVEYSYSPRSFSRKGNFGFVCSLNKIADGLTKSMHRASLSTF